VNMLLKKMTNQELPNLTASDSAVCECFTSISGRQNWSLFSRAPATPDTPASLRADPPSPQWGLLRVHKPLPIRIFMHVPDILGLLFGWPSGVICYPP
jgi:hypothetical protein